jgi:hypothetical protein
MKIAITSTGTDMDSPVDPRFGRGPYLAIVRPVQLNLCTRGYLPARHQAALSTNCNGIVCFRTQIP